MELLGLSRHHPPAAFIWSDVGPNVAALATLAGARGDARDVAGWVWHSAQAYSPVKAGTLQGLYIRTNNKQNISTSQLSANVADITLPRAPEVAAIIRTWKDEEPRALWERLKATSWPSLMPPKGMRWGQPIVGRWLGPCEVGEVAGWFTSSELAARGDPAAGYAGEQERYDAGKCWTRPNIKGVADVLDTLPSRWPRVACYQGTATRMVEQLPGDLSGFLVYIDGPYHGDGSRKITGYKFGGCSREEQLAMAADCHRRGARVAMSESVPLAA